MANPFADFMAGQLGYGGGDMLSRQFADGIRNAPTSPPPGYTNADDIFNADIAPGGPPPNMATPASMGYVPPARAIPSMPAPVEDAPAVTSGRAMESQSRSSIDDLLSQLTASHTADKENDRRLGWMDFFGKLASSKSPTLLGGLGEASGSLGETLAKQQDKQRAYASKDIEDQIALKKWQEEQAMKGDENASQAQLRAAQAKFYGAGGAGANRIIPAINPATNEVEFVTAGDARAKGFKPTTNYGALNTTLNPETIEAMADGLAKGATASSMGLGFGQSANKNAVLNRFAEKYPDVNLADAQVEITGNKAGARKIGTAGGQIEIAGQSLKSMIPLARDAADKISSTDYPSVNAIRNAVEKGTGDEKIIKLNTYLNAVMADHAALLSRTGMSTDATRAKAEEMANSALSKGQLGAYFDAVTNEIDAQGSAIKEAKKKVYGNGDSSSASPDAPAPVRKYNPATGKIE